MNTAARLRRCTCWITLAGALCLAPAMQTFSAEGPQTKMSQNLGYQDTPLLPGGKWHVHDGLRPQPPVVTPGPEAKSTAPPADAVALFNGKNLSHWRNGKGEPAGWKIVRGGAMEVVKGTGDIQSTDEFGDAQIHVEWRSPTEVHGNGQGRANSGVFIMGRYEVQVLDNYDNPTYPDGTAGAVYGQFPPLANACRKPGEWNVYDIFWTAPRFDGEKLVSPAYITILFNGVLVQNHTELIGATGHKTVGEYKAHPAQGPIKLQDHGDPVRFRNIWVRPLKPLADG